MAEASYEELCEQLFLKLEDLLDEHEDDLNYDSNGEICEITLDSGAKIIINRQPPVKEIWLAAKSGGYHFRYVDNSWIDTRNQVEFFERLAICLATT